MLNHIVGTHADCRILSMPFGPNVLLTKSPTAMAPTKAESRAFSPFSSVTSSPKICVGLKAALMRSVQLKSNQASWETHHNMRYSGPVLSSNPFFELGARVKLSTR